MRRPAISLLAFIQGYQEANGGITPSYTDMALGMGLTAKSKATVNRYVTELEREGWISRMKNRARAIQVLRPVSIPRDWAGRPLYFVRL